MLVALGVVMLYVAFRFQYKFAIGALLALVHDVVLTIGIFSELEIRFDLAIIAALLTIVGYSLNDTVVVFDRVRENLRKFKKMPLQALQLGLLFFRKMELSGFTLMPAFLLLLLGLG